MGTIGKLRKVLILSVSVGAGHMRTAEAIKKACGSLAPEAEVVILDTFRYANPLLEKVVLGTYMEMLKMTPVLYGYLYRRSEWGQPLSGRGKEEFNRILSLLSAPRLMAYIRDFEPQIIVCTHPFPLGIISYMKKRGKFNGLAVATITDFTIHSFWIFPHVDTYIVGSEALIPQCEQYGIEKKRIRATGIPIDPAFSKPYDKYRLRLELNLDPDLTTILLVGGGLGMGPLLSAVKSLGSGNNRLQLIVVSGANKVLYERLARTIPSLPCAIRLYGFVDNIHQLMAASDLMVGKAGGLTCAEALSLGLPMFIVDPLPGQEERNTEFICSMQAGVKVEEKDLAAVITNYLHKQSDIASMASAALGLGKPGAAYDVVDYMSHVVRDLKVL
ncbi:Processive diacylglycerol beta-glucosyltransferase [Pelotomaculum sp. FP]|uniref:MGDG synthase family glycosyltransferase n=1 Tax=Pelotomaculum sp. FP TaxID=261474 RepID=UPI001103F696|nr:glycosyltransferase [Pelotomaculum sp. FP]TEB16575.1 Processive diacylglycerol beta-glucosyltransferase [Pelotomaculum sp. FP]